MNTIRTIRFALPYSVAVVAACADPARPVAVHEPTEAAAQSPAGSAAEGTGYVAYRDPVTGKFTTPPPGAATAGQARTSSAATGLVEVPSPTSGTMIELNGRFQNQMAVQRSDAGAAEANCTEHDEAHHD
jgi:hypothetical protein